MTQVLIVEDQRMARERMEDYIQALPGYRLAGSITNAAMAEMVCMHSPVDLILMDVCTDRDESGLEAAARIKKHFPGIRIIIVTSMPEYSFLQKAKAAGAESFWYKDVGRQTLTDVIRRTMQGESVYPDKPPRLQIGQASSYEFTEKELEVLRLLVDGLSYSEMARELNVSVSAIKYHVNNMLQKTGYTSKTKLAVAVVNKKLIISGF